MRNNSGIDPYTNTAGLSSSKSQALATNKVLRNTYMLLAMTVLFSAALAMVAMVLNISQGASLILFIASFACIFWVHKSAESAQGLIAVFVFAGCMGASLGPMLNYYMASPAGAGIVFQALAGTGLIFLSLSGYALVTRKDFSFMGGFLTTGLILMVVASLLNIFLQVPLLSLVVPAGIILVMSGFILFDTSRIIHGGETNYIRATVSLYLNLFNIFISLLRLAGGVGDD